LVLPGIGETLALMPSNDSGMGSVDGPQGRFRSLQELALTHQESLGRLQAFVDEQEALRRVATLVAGDPVPSEVFERVCREVGTALGIEGTNITRFEEDGTQTVLAGWSVHGAPVFPLGGGVPLEGDAAVPKVNRTGRPARVDDYSEVSGELAEMIRAVGIASAVAAPITVAGKLWGAIVVTADRPYSFRNDTEERVASFAKLVADALANADARAQLAASRQRIVEAGDSERRRLERNLHDGAQQRLVSLALALREVQANLCKDPDAAERLIRFAREELDLALGELRELARGIHPAVLTDRGLGPALEALVARAPMPVHVKGLPTARVPQAVEAAAYYIAAEALTNAAKHAHARMVSLLVTQVGDGLRVEVSDDGIGGADMSHGSGLRGLADRVEALGGRLDVESPGGKGTRLVGRMPLHVFG
jgi:signal transduction histidine kinase